MIKLNQIKVDIESKKTLIEIVSEELHVLESEVKNVIILRKSIDARKKPSLFFIYTLLVDVENEESFVEYSHQNYNEKEYLLDEEKTDKDINPIVVGCGPSGMFCALQLAKKGLKPILLERGKPASQRHDDIAKLMNGEKLNLESNVLFGEGGAGTYSDGKLSTGTSSPLIKKVLRVFTDCGADKEIEYLAKPHIGSDILRTVVTNLTKQIIDNGGQVIFNQKVEELIFEGDKVTGVKTQNKTYKSNVVVLATGHSSRDTYRYLATTNVKMEAKPFSMGVRIEHKKELINLSQYGKESVENLKSASYKLVSHLPNGRTVYSFCMCPGGVVVPAINQEKTINVNGMSYFARNEQNSNSALMVSVKPEDYHSTSALDGIEFQEKYERKAYDEVNSGNTYFAPCQTLKDFIDGKISSEEDIREASYTPGVKSGNIKNCLPEFVYDSLVQSFPLFSNKIRNYDSPTALITGIETRSSSPVRIVRSDTRESETIKNLYPIGEGAGYAGGITSSAVDGIKTALEIINNF